MHKYELTSYRPGGNGKGSAFAEILKWERTWRGQGTERKELHCVISIKKGYVCY